MKRLGCVAITLILLTHAGRALAQEPTAGQPATGQTQPSAADGPSLRDTISFMDKSVRPEDSYVSSANPCEIYVLRNRTYIFGLAKGSHVKSTDQFGVAHYGLDWRFVEEPKITRFNFATIDPSTVHSKVLPSAAFVKEHNLDENPSEAKNADLTVVFFDSMNLAKSIETGQFKSPSDGQEATPVFDHQSGMGFIAFESKDRAERFVTAFLHAIELCGGKKSDIAPTPSKP
jgi:hypothetical protein